MRIDYAMLSRHSIQSTSDQEDYIKYATIAANAPSGLTPEQAAEMYHLLAIARYEDRFVVPTSGRENHDDVWAMKGSEGLAQGEMEERP